MRTFVLDKKRHTSATHTASSYIGRGFPRAHSLCSFLSNSGDSVLSFYTPNTRTTMTRTNVCKGVKHSSAIANIILTRDVETDIARTSTTYSLGWGDGKLQGNPLTYHELWALSRLIERVLSMDARALRSRGSFRGVTSTTYQLGRQSRTERLRLCGGNLIPAIN